MSSAVEKAAATIPHAKWSGISLDFEWSPDSVKIQYLLTKMEGQNRMKNSKCIKHATRRAMPLISL